MTKAEREVSEGIANLTDINRAYFLAILRSLNFAQEHSGNSTGKATKKETA